MNWYLLWRYKTWIAIAVLSFAYLGQLAYTNHLASELNKADADKAEAVVKAVKPYIEAAEKQKDKLNKASEQYEKLKAERQVKTETVTREVQKIVERPIYLYQCFDADGVSAINRLSTDTS